ncbi:MAG: sortase [Acidimicrobiales bacterium]
MTATLIEPEFTIPAPPPEPVAPAPEVQRAALRRRRRVVGIAVVSIVAALVLSQLVGLLMESQRQRHLAFDMQTPDAHITAGEAALLLQIPDIGVNVVVAEGASSEELRGGPGRVIGTANLGDGGNVVVLGRRTRFGGPFGRLGELTKGSAVVAKSRGGIVRAYTVTSVYRTSTDNASPLRSTSDRITLVTSDGRPTRRLVVVATADADPPATTSPRARLRLGADSLDERSTGALGTIAALVLLGGSVVAAVVGMRRLSLSYQVVTIAKVVVPIVSLLMIVGFVIGDSLLPVTF